MNKRRKIIKDGVLDLAGFKLPCYNLEDGTRILSSNSMQLALQMVDKDDKQERGPKLKHFLNQKALEPFVDKEKQRGTFFEPIMCYKGEMKINGYEATTLVDICNIYLSLEKETIKQGKKLPARQAIIADRSRILLGAIAKIGIIALVDEATGYQYERERFELQKILKLLVLKDKLFSKWKEMFPLDFYMELFEVYDIPFTPENIKRKPRFIGWLTNELVYKNLPEGSFVLAKIKARTPKTSGGHYKKKFHQSLTKIGKSALTEVINTVKTLAWISKKDKDKRNSLSRLVKERFSLERDLPYVDIEANE